MMRIAINKGRIIDPINQIDKQQDIFIADGVIAAVGQIPDGFVADKTIDANNLIVAPGLIDLSTHLREPGQEYKATIKSETNAAAKSGITTLCCWPDTKTVIDTPAVIELIQQRAQDAGFAKVVSLAALTGNLAGERLSEMAALKEAGCVGVTNANQPILQTDILRHAFEYASTYDLTVFITPEDYWLARNGCVNEGAISTRLGLHGIPAVAETIALVRSLQLIEYMGVRAHFCKLSTAGSVEIIQQAKAKGLPITADVAAHQLALTEMDITEFDTNCHVRPPLRSTRDQEVLTRAVKEGIIDAICSDHQPHENDAKLKPFSESEPGISGLETLLPLALRLRTNDFSLRQVLSCLTCNPARILGLQSGTLTQGAAADLILFDDEKYFNFSKESMQSAGKNTPFIGWDFQGQVVTTILDGRIVYRTSKLKSH